MKILAMNSSITFTISLYNKMKIPGYIPMLYKVNNNSISCSQNRIRYQYFHLII